jgi:hypothetical protein
MFIPRHPVVENQFCSYGAVTSASAATGVGGVIAYAGAVVYLDNTATNQEPIVYKMAHGVSEPPFGFAMQKVKTGYHQVHPTGFVMPGDLGSSDVIAQPSYDNNGAVAGVKEAPLGVAHLGIWDTVHYTAAGVDGDDTTPTTPSAALAPGDELYPAADEAKVTTSTTDSDGSDYNGERCDDVQVASVVKGASVAKATANIANTTLYPIRIKLLV